MADIFISYSSTDKTVVKHLAQLLEAQGWTVWWDRQIPIGQQYDTVIETELQQARCVLVVWTARSIASEWVKNEASEAASKNKLVPVMMENLQLPLAFRRTEAAQLLDWDGDPHHPELEILFHSIAQIMGQDPEAATGKPKKKVDVPEAILRRQRLWIGAGLTLVVGSLLVYGRTADGLSQRNAILLLIAFSLGLAAATWGMVHLHTLKQQLKPTPLLKISAPLLGLFCLVLGGLLLAGNSSEKNITVRIFDWKKNPITQGEVKIYLPEYIRTQSIDKMGQALFTGIPAGTLQNNMKIEVNSPGYASKIFDTLLRNTKPLELTLPLTTVVFISGKIKTAAEMPIKEVEISADGTRYYAISITDGSYNLRLEEYTLGDEISLTTSHPGFEDKTVSLRIQSPNIQNQDIFLNPIAH